MTLILISRVSRRRVQMLRARHMECVSVGKEILILAKSVLFASGALALMSAGCSSTTSKVTPGGTGGGTSGTGGADAGHRPATGGANDAGPPAVHTTAACGDLPILGDFAGSYGPIPDDCKSCVEAQCCDEANACAADAGCKKYKDCYAANGCYQFGSCPACGPLTGDSATLSNAFNNCRTSCDSCLDLRCAGKPWPTFSAASLSEHLTVNSFTASTPFAGVIVKACGAADHDCTSLTL
jgi:hypothetical protein